MEIVKFYYGKVTQIVVLDAIKSRVHFNDGSKHTTSNPCFTNGKVKEGDLIGFDGHGSVWKKQ